MLESQETLDPAAALAAAQEARAGVARSVSYPRWYTAGTALQAALLMVGAATLAPDFPAPWIQAAFAVAMCASLVLAGVNLRRFQEHNGARITGFRFGRGPSIVYLMALVALAIGVANRANVANVWWSGLAAAPVAAALSWGYLAWWLAAYRREQG